MSDVAYAEPEIAHLPKAEPHHATETHAAPQEAATEPAQQNHVNSDTQKRIAVQNLNKMSFLIAPDGSGAIAAEPMKSDGHSQIVNQSLKIVLGSQGEGVTYTTTQDKGFLGLPVGDVPRIQTAEAVQTLAVAGVKDFADALGISPSTHAARIR